MGKLDRTRTEVLRSHTAWVAVNGAPTGFSARLKEGLNADREASDATRLAGTRNYKLGYAPDFPLVRTVDARPGQIVTPSLLAALGALAPEKPKPPPLPFVASPGRPRTEKWPNYQQCLDRAPLGSSGHPKRTAANFIWCNLSWGHDIETTAARLLQESTKAQENGEGRVPLQRSSGGNRTTSALRTWVLSTILLHLHSTNPTSDSTNAKTMSG